MASSSSLRVGRSVSSITVPIIRPLPLSGEGRVINYLEDPGTALWRIARVSVVCVCVCVICYLLPIRAARRAMAAGFLNDRILSQTEMVGPSRASLSPTP